MDSANSTRGRRRHRPDRQDLRDHRCIGRPRAGIGHARSPRRARTSSSRRAIRKPLRDAEAWIRAEVPDARDVDRRTGPHHPGQRPNRRRGDPGPRARDPRADEQRRGDVHSVQPNRRWLRNPVRHKSSRALRTDPATHPAACRGRPHRDPVVGRTPDERRRPRRPQLGAAGVRQVRRLRRVEDRQCPAHGRAGPTAARPRRAGVLGASRRRRDVAGAPHDARGLREPDAARACGSRRSKRSMCAATSRCPNTGRRRRCGRRSARNWQTSVPSISRTAGSARTSHRTRWTRRTPRSCGSCRRGSAATSR